MSRRGGRPRGRGLHVGLDNEASQRGLILDAFGDYGQAAGTTKVDRGAHDDQVALALSIGDF